MACFPDYLVPFQALLDPSIFFLLLKKFICLTHILLQKRKRQSINSEVILFSQSILPTYSCLSTVCLTGRPWQVGVFLPWTVANFVFKNVFVPHILTVDMRMKVLYN